LSSVDAAVERARRTLLSSDYRPHRDTLQAKRLGARCNRPARPAHPL